MLHMFQQPVKHHIVSCAAHVTKGGSAQVLPGTSCTPEFVMQPGLTDPRPVISPDLTESCSLWFRGLILMAVRSLDLLIANVSLTS